MNYKLKNRLSGIAFLSALLASCFAQEFSYSGKLSYHVSPAYGIHDSDLKGDYVEDKLMLEGEGKYYSGDCMFYADGVLCFDRLENDFDNRLKEAWFDWNKGLFALRAGRQIAGWGKADDLEVADVLCPKDNTSILTDYSSSRMGIDAVRLSLTGSTFSGDFYLIPHFTPAKLPESKKNLLYTCKFADAELGKLEEPENKAQNSEFGIKLNANFSAADISVYGFSGWDDEPVARYSVDGAGHVTVNGIYKRLWMVALDAAVPASDFVFRFESAFFPQKYFSTLPESQFAGEKSYVQRNFVKGLAGIDWSPYPFTITAQYYAEYIDGSEEKLDAEKYDHQVTLSISRTFLNESLEVEASGALRLNDYDNAEQVKISYAATDNLKLILQTDFFNSGKDDKPGFYGKYKNLDCCTLKAEFKF